MADWRLLAQRLALADECIESQDARIIREGLFGDGKVDKSRFDFLVTLRRKARSVAVEFDETVFGVVKQVLIKNGGISPERTKWLKSFLGPKGGSSKHERAFLQDLQGSGNKHCPEFVAWCKSLGVSSTSVTPRESKSIPVATLAPNVIVVEEVEPITVTPIDSYDEPIRRRQKRTSRMGESAVASRMGFISLAIAIFVYVVTFLLIMIAAIFNSPSTGTNSGTTAVVISIFVSPFVTLVGSIIGLIGIFRPGPINRLCAVFGIIFNGLVVLGCTIGMCAIFYQAAVAPK